ncbi:hypothetical protein C0Q70_11452 [Pomacea canaliculata]|uniref:Uncharacterized protein n=1 Tax=Pomacea canaliculata TaxID=400727 RepID=A0A2T7P613_POMCA|nr:hypothetical protein C0Q70_11452 [Pomacea canaliculata]
MGGYGGPVATSPGTVPDSSKVRQAVHIAGGAGRGTSGHRRPLPPPHPTLRSLPPPLVYHPLSHHHHTAISDKVKPPPPTIPPCAVGGGGGGGDGQIALASLRLEGRQGTAHRRRKIRRAGTETPFRLDATAQKTRHTGDQDPRLIDLTLNMNEGNTERPKKLEEETKKKLKNEENKERQEEMGEGEREEKREIQMAVLIVAYLDISVNHNEPLQDVQEDHTDQPSRDKAGRPPGHCGDTTSTKEDVGEADDR